MTPACSCVIEQLALYLFGFLMTQNACKRIVCIFYVESGTGGGASQRDVVQLRRANQQLYEENNLLKVKMDLLLDMVSVSFRT